MEEYYKRQHRPRPKLKMPFFGGGNDNGQQSSGTGTGQDINPRQLMYLIGAIVIFVILFELFDMRKGDGSIGSKSDIYEAEWKGVVKKKYIAYDNPNITRIDIYQNGKSTSFDLSNDKSGLFNYLNPRDSIYKTKENFVVKVIRAKARKTYTLNYSK